MTMFEKHFTPDQLQEIQARGRQIGQERIREVEAEWPRLITEVRAAMESGTDPASAEVQQLAQRWMGLVREFTGGNPGIQQGSTRCTAKSPRPASAPGSIRRSWSTSEKRSRRQSDPHPHHVILRARDEPEGSGGWKGPPTQILQLGTRFRMTSLLGELSTTG
jgi:hypothetical protein